MILENAFDENLTADCGLYSEIAQEELATKKHEQTQRFEINFIS